jgi:hypothetical protein
MNRKEIWNGLIKLRIGANDGSLSTIQGVSKCHTRVNMLTRVWQELEYRIDVCRVTSGAHIENL